jgi:hypothetical protein
MLAKNFGELHEVDQEIQTLLEKLSGLYDKRSSLMIKKNSSKSRKRINDSTLSDINLSIESSEKGLRIQRKFGL